jgi:hypothetical protein
LIGQAEERAGVPGGEPLLVHHRLHVRWKLEQPEEVGDCRPVQAYGPGDLRLTQLELLAQAAEARRFIDRREIVALQVLDQREGEQRAVVHFLHDRGDLRPAESLGGTPATLAGDQLVAAVARAHDDGLEQSRRLHRVGEIGELCFVDPGPRLKRVGSHARNRQVAQRAGCLGLFARDRAEQRLEPSSQPFGLGHVVTSGRCWDGGLDG